MKDIKGFEGKYAVNKEGEIWSYPRWGTGGGWVKKWLQRRGYYNVYLGRGVAGQRKILLVHKAVATTYIPNPLGRKEINHKNGNKLDNRVENLEWCTHQENMKHAYKNGLVKPLGKHEKHAMAKLNKTKVLEIRDLYKKGGISQRALGKMFNVNQALIWLIIKNRIWVFD